MTANHVARPQGLVARDDNAWVAVFGINRVSDHIDRQLAEPCAGLPVT